MRPPYFEFNAEVLRVMKQLKYRVIITDIDTNDWKGDLETSFQSFTDGIEQGGSIVLAHDVSDLTVNQLLPRMIRELRKRKMTCK